MCCDKGVRFRRLPGRAMACLFLAATPLAAADFLRGDVNGDGRVSVADAAFLFSNLFFGAPPRLECEASADFEDDGRIDLTDGLRILRFVLIGLLDEAGSGPPAEPFPTPGPDPTSGQGGSSLPCDAYGTGFSVADPAARLEVAGAVAPGGEDVHAVITLKVSSSVPLWGYSGTVSAGSGVLENAVYRSNDPIGIQVLNAPADGAYDVVMGSVEDGRLHVGYLGTVSDPAWIPPGLDAPAISISVCLKAGTAAGNYPLTLEAGELVRGWSIEMDGQPDAPGGRAISPALVHGTLTVLEDVAPEATCEIRPPEGELNASFALLGTTAPPGSEVRIPFVVRADRECQGFGCVVAFDTETLEALEIEELYPAATGKPYREGSHIDNAAGTIQAYVNFGFGPEDFALPPHRNHEVLALRFHVKPDATAKSTEVRFVEGLDGDQRNFFKAFADTYTPATASTFVFVNGIVSVLPDGTLFIRGDTNGDGQINISDPQDTLSYLFLGGRRPACYDAADANDDGRLDVSDPVATLSWLFLGERPLPPPSETEGEDPTPDALGCFYGR